jgi:tripartite-type tricarboxylate transporter receptor subunit TctC
LRRDGLFHPLTRRSLLAAIALTCILPDQGDGRDRLLKIVYPFAAGGSSEAVARIIAEELQKSLAQTVIVENRAGAGGRLGARTVQHAVPDGNTLLFGASPQFTLQPHYAPDLGYDPFTDFLPVSQIMTFDPVLVVSADLPVHTIGELASWLKSNPDRAIYGSPGAGSGAHFAGIMLGRAFDMPLRHLPYKGTPAALPDLMTGRVPLYIGSGAELIEHIKVGTIRILATLGAERSSLLPNTPTFQESGIDIAASAWFAVYAPAGTAPARIGELESAIRSAMRDPGIRAKIEALGFHPVGSTAEELMHMQKSEFDRWWPIVRSSGFKQE